MGFSTALEHTALTIDVRILDKCLRIWRQREYKGSPPDPNEVLYMSTSQTQVLTLAEIYRFYADEDKRKAAGLA